jgi:hypothetical protein
VVEAPFSIQQVLCFGSCPSRAQVREDLEVVFFGGQESVEIKLVSWGGNQGGPRPGGYAKR